MHFNIRLHRVKRMYLLPSRAPVPPQRHPVPRVYPTLRPGSPGTVCYDVAAMLDRATSD